MQVSAFPEQTCSSLSTGPQEPCTIVIFGASGDLTTRKLLPALFNLFAKNNLPEPITIVGCSRTILTNEEFRTKLQASCTPSGTEEGNRWQEFTAALHYHPITYDLQADYLELAAYLDRLDEQRTTRGNRIFYLAVPPNLYPVIAEKIGGAGLAAEGKDGKNWSRLVVEKPFGRDLETALALDLTIHANFKEHQVFRIDHYLAKETVQNILMLRFANTLFEPLWNRNHIEYIAIVAAEDLGVEHRAGYYEQAGVIRDMFQNHLMQLLALTAIEPPPQFKAAWVQDEKVKIFRSLKPFSTDRITEDLILGQYGPGTVGGKEVIGYRQEPGVDPASITPTFALLRLFIDNWRWRDVPFYLLSGKRLQEKITKIIIQFKKVPHSMFRDVLDENITANRLILSIYPEEEISLTFQVKKPAARTCLQSVNMEYKYDQEYNGYKFGAYEKVLLDCIHGDRMHFWRQDGVELTWAFLTPILQKCETCLDKDKLVHFYNAGSWGPERAQNWTRLFMD
jgi:glucose-6-phosphate 1-dehydrogenase